MLSFFLLFLIAISAITLTMFYRALSLPTTQQTKPTPINLSTDKNEHFVDHPPLGMDAESWSVWVSRRQEFESDTLLDEATKADLRREWLQSLQTFLSENNNNQDKPSTSINFTVMSPLGLAMLLSGIFSVAALFYIGWGRWDEAALQRYSAQAAPSPMKDTGRSQDIVDPKQPHPGSSSSSMADRVKALQTKLADNPDDFEGWVLLARSFGAQREFAKGAEALEKALALSPGHPDVLADLADMIAMTQNKSMTGRPLTLVEEALRNEPRHPKALALAATAALERGDQTQAQTYWSQLKAIQAEMESQQAQTTKTVPPPVKQVQQAADVKAVVSGTIDASPELRKMLSQKSSADVERAVVYVIAKSPNGPPMPLAVGRYPASDLVRSGKLSFEITDQMAMNPALPAPSEQKALMIEARLAWQGQANRQTGDWFSKAANVAPGEQSAHMTIDQVVSAPTNAPATPAAPAR